MMAANTVETFGRIDGAIINQGAYGLFRARLNLALDLRLMLPRCSAQISTFNKGPSARPRHSLNG
jgi:hypothetical protein